MANPNIKPLSDRVLVKPLEAEEKSKGGIIIPDSAKEKPQEAQVVALGTGKEQKISITGSSGLSKEEVEKMQKEAEAHAEDDRKAKETIEIRNNADNLAYQCEKQLKELGDKVDGASKKNVEDAIEKVREALKGDDADTIKAAYDDLQTKFQEVTTAAYKAAASSAGPAPEDASGASSAEPQPKKDDVVDAEFEVVDDEKKK